MGERERYGIEELRLIVRNMDCCNGNFTYAYTADELLKIGRMHLASGWDIYPDQWTPRQVKEALEGKVPQWDDQERPVYDPPEVFALSDCVHWDNNPNGDCSGRIERRRDGRVVCEGCFNK